MMLGMVMEFVLVTVFVTSKLQMGVRKVICYSL